MFHSRFHFIERTNIFKNNNNHFSKFNISKITNENLFLKPKFYSNSNLNQFKNKNNINNFDSKNRISNEKRILKNSNFLFQKLSPLKLRKRFLSTKNPLNENNNNNNEIELNDNDPKNIENDGKSNKNVKKDEAMLDIAFKTVFRAIIANILITLAKGGSWMMTGIIDFKKCEFFSISILKQKS